MGAEGEKQKNEAPYRPLVTFDFDGTLTCKDSFLAFLAWRQGTLRYAMGLARLGAPLIAYASDRDRTRLKAQLVRTFLEGVARETLAEEAARFAAQCSRRLLRADAVRCWKAWQERGARLVIVTASPDIVVAPFARGLGAETLIATRLHFDADGRASGGLDGPNCRGPEKVNRLREAFGAQVRLDAAYGDSDGDKEMLAMSEEPAMRVFTGRP
jgi:phosphatidylglycerophosphatase C